ncbi:hypothetical protein [Streptomyces mesophilus]
MARPPQRAAKPRRNDEGEKVRAFRGHFSPIAIVRRQGLEPRTR